MNTGKHRDTMYTVSITHTIQHRRHTHLLSVAPARRALTRAAAWVCWYVRRGCVGVLVCPALGILDLPGKGMHALTGLVHLAAASHLRLFCGHPCGTQPALWAVACAFPLRPLGSTIPSKRSTNSTCLQVPRCTPLLQKRFIRQQGAQPACYGTQRSA